MKVSLVISSNFCPLFTFMSKRPSMAEPPLNSMSKSMSSKGAFLMNLAPGILTWARPPSKGLAGLLYFSWKRIPMEEKSNSLSHSPVLLFSGCQEALEVVDDLLHRDDGSLDR